jgi:hypothetical protein
LAAADFTEGVERAEEEVVMLTLAAVEELMPAAVESPILAVGLLAAERGSEAGPLGVRTLPRRRLMPVVRSRQPRLVLAARSPQRRLVRVVQQPQPRLVRVARSPQRRLVRVVRPPRLPSGRELLWPRPQDANRSSIEVPR